MKILVLNCGSSSLKYQLIDMSNESVLAKGLCERIGTEGSVIIHQGKGEYSKESPMETHKDAISLLIDALLDKEYGVISSIEEVNAVGHRIVHGGESFSESVIITDEVYEGIKAGTDLAPLHTPANLMGVDACKALLPNVNHVAVFDTAFHQTMPPKAFLYPLPYEYYEKYRIRRYGFHGTSHRYVSAKVAEAMGKPIEELKIISAHLGSGASVCAIEGGKSVDTSMGFTPLEGLAMGTRSGDIDPAIVSFLATKENLTPKEVESILNKKSGVLGLSQVSNDFRDLEKAAEEGNVKAQNALDVYCYRVAKYIGAYAAVLNGADAIVFTAGIGENSSLVREKITSCLCYLGVEIDATKNNTRGTVEISADSSKIKVFVIPTDEELVIARDTQQAH